MNFLSAWSDVYDGWGFDPANDISLTHSYDVTFSATADPGTVYDIAIDPIFAGMIKQVDDDWNGYGQANAGNDFSVTMDQNGDGTASQPTRAGSVASFGSDYSAVSQGFNQPGSLALSDLTGTTNLAFSVSLDSRVHSYTDDVGLLLGLALVGLGMRRRHAQHPAPKSRPHQATRDDSGAFPDRGLDVHEVPRRGLRVEAR